MTHIPTSRHLSDSQHICSQKRHTDLLQVANLTGLSTSCNKSAKIRLVATCHLQTCHSLLKQIAASLWITSFENQLATSLLTTCNRLVVHKASQAMRCRLVDQICSNISTDSLQLARFSLCNLVLNFEVSRFCRQRTITLTVRL